MTWERKNYHVPAESVVMVDELEALFKMQGKSLSAWLVGQIVNEHARQAEGVRAVRLLRKRLQAGFGEGAVKDPAESGPGAEF